MDSSVTFTPSEQAARLKIKESFLRNDRKGWGSPLWFSLSEMADAFPDNPTEEDLEHARGFLHHMSYLMKCEECNQHCRAYLKANPPNFKTGTEFSDYILRFRQAVDARTKPVDKRRSKEQIQEMNAIMEHLDWGKLIASAQKQEGVADSKRVTSDSVQSSEGGTGIASVLKESALPVLSIAAAVLFLAKLLDNNYTEEPSSSSSSRHVYSRHNKHNNK